MLIQGVNAALIAAKQQLVALRHHACCEMHRSLLTLHARLSRSQECSQLPVPCLICVQSF
jgi:hypothetical protein